MKVLVACEFSGKVRDAFIRRGHRAVSCDLLPGEGVYKDAHIQGDVRPLLENSWDMVIAHPPCTYLCNSGVRWLSPGGVRDEKRWNEMRLGAEFFAMFLNADHIDKICIENPIMHKYAKEIIGQTQTQIIQPWQFGHGETKATCLWLKGLEPLKPTNVVDGRAPVCHHASPGPDRWKLRSMTYDGIASAMAGQWG